MACTGEPGVPPPSSPPHGPQRASTGAGPRGSRPTAAGAATDHVGAARDDRSAPVGRARDRSRPRR
ncbi:hypothetical protein E9934_09905 [Nocardioides caeni]|uniref:Uncharacterized protein n=1 Tax=Nocardioides caeni TaxID=574700 RepID=A0A4S8NAT1_9ACTN|nr:hypothetical protein E9934_09905 [Nocardioides caeni]